ncbi:DMT family transporter [Dethiosulfatarculus sandiegensis]|uniref:Multidrug transporter n=1 Tax=Dethiosulfatarculus sandiegensis TaxID=1429043 RepID=A0A0D2JHC6_9BACT|nr:multidrug efflux SMR transporter [Dethiosulfatarculus sandiegensis]KIX15146.1 multidrug transporter [Dethiosulfatarculus sandiegensis]
MGFVFLFLAISAEIVGTSALKASQQFTRLYPSLLVVLGYGAAFFLLGQVLKYIPMGVAYAFWAGLGIVLITLVDVFFYKQPIDLAAGLGIALIVSGVVVIHVFSKAVV